MTTTGSDRPALDVTDMIAVHRVFRDTLGRAAAVIGAVGDGDIDRVATVANFFDNILLFLHVHHQGEDDLMFPLLRQRCPDQLELIDRVASQHGDANEKVAAAQGIPQTMVGQSRRRGRTVRRGHERIGRSPRGPLRRRRT